MQGISTKKIVLNGLLIALVFLTTYFTKIYGIVPPPGYINLGDAVILITAILLGGRSGFLAGSVGSALADVLAPGGIIFAPVTFIVKGLEGYVTGKIVYGRKKGTTEELTKIAGVVTGAAVMVAGYFIGELYFLKLFDNTTFGYAFAIGELPGNVLQGGVSAVVGYLLSTVLVHAGIRKYM